MSSTIIRQTHEQFVEILLRLVMRRWKAAQNAHGYPIHSAFSPLSALPDVRSRRISTNF
jgi:hypothetical protein